MDFEGADANLMLPSGWFGTFTSGDDVEAKRVVIELIDSIGFVAIDLGSLAIGGAMHQVGGPLSGVDLHFVRRLR